MIEPNFLSYKDFSARVVQKNNLFYRYIFKCYKNEYDNLMNSGLYEELIKKNLLISHIEIAISNNDPGVYKCLFPTQLSFQSYPYEWSFRQWRKVIIAYLTINEIALKYGMILKDATPYNFFLDSNKAILFDTSSFVFFNDNDKWLAYRQFCEMLLGPFVLMRYNGHSWAKLYQSQLQGISLNFISRQLPVKSWFNLTVFLHIHLHAKHIKYFSEVNKYQNLKKGFSIEKIQSMISLLKGTVISWNQPYLFKNYWDKYYEKDIENEAYIKSKQFIIENWLSFTKPLSVLDLGANTGKFSVLASKYSEKIIALEADENCVDEIDRIITPNKISKIFPLVGDLSQPSPAMGVLNKEYLPIFERANSEMVLCLALIHHLYFTNDLNFSFIAEILSKLSFKYLILEFVPKDDRRVKGLSSGKRHRIEGYNYESFVQSHLIFFELMDTKKLDSSNRILFLFKKRYA